MAPLGNRPRYHLRVDVKPVENLVEGDVAVRFTPDLSTDRLVFRLWPNAPTTARAGARLEVSGLRVGGREVETTLENPTTLVARPAGGLRAGRLVEAAAHWRLTLPGPVRDRVSRRGDAIRLGSFFPILSWEPGIGWATEPPTSAFAEASTSPAADITADVTVPAGLDVLATGTSTVPGRWSATAVPDFAMSVGHFTTASATVNLPQPVQVTVGVHAGIPEPPGAYLARITSALQDLSRRYGAYPWPSYSMAVTPDLRGGIEYPTHVMQGPGSAGRTTPHEVAHMWFYALVGNAQGRDPWLDEGLATWAEYRLERSLAALLAASIPLDGRGRVGEPMTFWERRQASYYRSVYVQGAQALAALGDPDAVDCALRLYVARTAFRIARPRDLVEATRAVFPGAEATLASFGIRP
ncbi:MAG: hypothetical protein M3N68_07215 [Actinomycetota bacterium]|nr:hypothetical protein [Actinomycetota bacterium]